jgi:hypothetical protein
MEKEFVIPPYPTCRVCRTYFSDICGDCLNETNTTRFQARKGLTLFDLPPFPSIDFNDGMPVRMRQAVIGTYMEIIVRTLQEGR